MFFFFKQKTAYEIRFCDWSSDVCSSDLFFGHGIIGIGANAFYWKQFTADSGSGAKLGSFETNMTGIGPVLSYISPPICGHTLVAEVKWLPEIDTFRTLKGDYVWFKLALAF